jgi:ubiquinone biosynthesis monooxygenase Coq7
VDHAGERGAICIYKSQIAVSRIFHPTCVDALVAMLAHEQRHFATFEDLLKARGIRHCHALTFWAFGGWALGSFTALLGQRAIWTCTAAIENTVNGHLEHQVEVLRISDPEVLAAVESIRRDEKEHEDHAVQNGGDGRGLFGLLHWLVRGVTSFAIWLSTKL